jgi:adenylate cyclase
MVPEKVSLSEAKARKWSVDGGKLRLWSGLVLFSFATTHFINHAFGLVSVDLMQAGQDLRTAITRSMIGTAVLLAAATIHFLFGIAKFFNARTMRLGYRSVVQLLFGLLIPIFLIRHIVGTRGVSAFFGIKDTYEYALWAMWPNEAISQAILMMLVWVHGCIGLHHWLFMKPWYRNNIWFWYALAVLIPALSYAGFVAASHTSQLQTTYKNPFSPDQYATIKQALSVSAYSYYIVLFCAVGIWLLLLAKDRWSRKIVINYVNGPTVSATAGVSLLDISRSNRIPHASVCGGRARCSTCRVRVLAGLQDQPPASEAELLVLRRVGSPPNVRLACQLRPTANLTVSTLLPADFDAKQSAQVDKYLWGIEQEVTLLFCDLRGFTKMSEGRLSFDVVFILNQFLGRMAEAIEDTGGFVDKFMGDGIMAIFGMDEAVPVGATRAIAAARAMGGVLDSLNQSMKEELPTPLSMGIGIHTGPAILGRIGAASRTKSVANLTALGETVNIASRLESKAKDLGQQVAISAYSIAQSGLAPGEKVTRHSVEVRGLSNPIDIYACSRATDLPEAI